MTIITIPKELIKEKELILVSRRKYEEFLKLQKLFKNRTIEERDTDLAIKIYKKEKKQRRLKVIKSLADLE